MIWKTKEGILKYVGSWKNDMMDGLGTYFWPNEKIYYKGPFISNKREGKEGYMSYGDGSFYFGDFKNDMRHGQGSFTFANNDRFEGNWIDDAKDGQGVYYCSD